MEPYIIKALSAALLWTISVCFGVILPYFIWKISPRKPHHRESGLAEEDISDQDNELDNLILNRLDERNQRSGVLSACKRFASWMRVRFTNGKFLSLVNCLCGGVFLGVSLLDLVPQSRSAITAVLEQSETVTSYPVAEFMISLGLLLVMIIENLVSSVMLSGGDKGGRSVSSHGRNDENTVEELSGDEDTNNVDIKDNISSYRMYVLVITLSLHSVFEGLAIGLQKEVSAIIQLMIAISVHKAVLSFGIGLPLFETLGKVGKMCTAVTCAMIFCTASPLGCIIGVFVSTDDISSSFSTLIASAILQCLATGTFLYVTFVEMIPREFSHHSHEHSKDTINHTPKNFHSHDDVSSDSAMEDRNTGLDNQTINVTGRQTPYFKASNKPRRNQSEITKLLALVVGFAIASGLQFL